MSKIRFIVRRPKPRATEPLEVPGAIEVVYRCGHCGGEMTAPAGRRWIRRYCAQADHMVWVRRVRA